jgi:hypothetical protein
LPLFTAESQGHAALSPTPYTVRPPRRSCVTVFTVFTVFTVSSRRLSLLLSPSPLLIASRAGGGCAAGVGGVSEEVRVSI